MILLSICIWLSCVQTRLFIVLWVETLPASCLSLICIQPTFSHKHTRTHTYTLRVLLNLLPPALLSAEKSLDNKSWSTKNVVLYRDHWGRLFTAGIVFGKCCIFVFRNIKYLDQAVCFCSCVADKEQHPCLLQPWIQTDDVHAHGCVVHYVLQVNLRTCKAFCCIMNQLQCWLFTLATLQLLRPDGVVPRHDQIHPEAGVRIKDKDLH